MATIPLPFVNTLIQPYVYEPFSFTISNPYPEPSTLTTTLSSGIPSGYVVTTNRAVVFAASSNAMAPGSDQDIVITARVDGVIAAVSSNVVRTLPGRFVDATGAGYTGRVITLFAKEPSPSNVLVAPFAISIPTSVPTLPPGLVFTSNASNRYTLAGTPLVPVPRGSYTLIGKATGSNLGKIVTSAITLTVNSERIQTILAGSPILSDLTVGVAIAPRIFTTQSPPGSTIRYTWPRFPEGLEITDGGGVVKTSPFTPVDPSATLILRGTPTISAAQTYRDSGGTPTTLAVTATRPSPLPSLTTDTALTFGFSPTVLIDASSIPQLFRGVTLDPSAISFTAETFFTSTPDPITSIVAPTLDNGLALSFTPGTGRAFLTGTPNTAKTASYTIRATSSLARTRDLGVSITVVSDTVSFEPPTPADDTPVTVVLSRPVTQSLVGVYTAPLVVKAAAASRVPVTFSVTGLEGTGLSISSVSASSVELVGTPEIVVSVPRDVTFTASAVGTPATASRRIRLAISNDVITMSQPSAQQLAFIQNRAITPIQLFATTLSGRPVLSFTSTTLPSGLALTSGGLITGTPLASAGSSFTVIATTGFMSHSQPYSYTLTPDSLLLIERPSPAYALTLGGAIPAATITGLTYSGLVASNFVFTDFPVTYGITLGNVTGVVGGTLTTSFPPEVLLPSNVSFAVQATAGALTASLPVLLATSNAPRFQWFILKGTTIGRTEETLNQWIALTSESVSDDLTDMSIRSIDVNRRSILAVTHTDQILYSPTGSTFERADLPRTPWPFYGIPGAPPVSNGTTLRLGPRVLVRGAGTTVYGTGTDDVNSTVGGFWSSSNDGLSWTQTFPLLASGFQGVQWLANAVTLRTCIAYATNVLLLGGVGLAPTNPPIIRSTNGGASWAAVPTGLRRMVNAFNTDTNRWIAAGSDTYLPNEEFTTASRTLRVSDDTGSTWALVTSGDFNLMAQFLVYGNERWLAGGEHYEDGDSRIYASLRSSTDGLVWSSVAIPGTAIPSRPTVIDGSTQSRVIESILYDGASYIVTFTTSVNDVLTQSFIVHAADGTSLDSGWSTVNATTLTALSDGQPFLESNRVRRLLGRIPVSLDPPTPILSFPSQAGSGPTVTSPAFSFLRAFQYVPIEPIVLSAVGSAVFFILDSDLPRGLTFNPVTNTLSGTPMVLGSSQILIYAKNDAGVTVVSLDIVVVIATVTRQQTSAGAWTSLTRQYTVVNAAQTSVNGQARPSTQPPLGEFMRPTPPDSVSATVCPDC
jgi:hypothetical protein